MDRVFCWGLPVTGRVSSAVACCSVAVWVVVVSPLSSAAGDGFWCVIGSGSVVWVGFLACVSAASGIVGLLAGASSGWSDAAASFAVLSSLNFDASLQNVFPLHGWWNFWFLWWCRYVVRRVSQLSSSFLAWLLLYLRFWVCAVWIGVACHGCSSSLLGLQLLSCCWLVCWIPPLSLAIEAVLVSRSCGELSFPWPAL